MPTHYGLNPSFCTWTSRLPLFADPLRRGRAFEVFSVDGLPTGEASPIGPDGRPVPDGRRHGVRLFGSMGGTMPELPLTARQYRGWRLRVHEGESAYLSWTGGAPTPEELQMLRLYPASRGRWHEPSLQALESLRPRVLRTLDWQMANKRLGSYAPRVSVLEPLQGTDRGMAVELQAEAANLLGCTLWWTAPPRYTLGVEEYVRLLEDYLSTIGRVARQAPILEYGNELWNAGFPVHNWLRGLATRWVDAAAAEIDLLGQTAARVLGDQGRDWYLFVGGHLQTPSTLEQILESMTRTPNLAGPALYVDPLKASIAEWEASGAVPSQDELRQSCWRRMDEMRPLLARHREVLDRAGVKHLACYEAGQSMIARGRPWRSAALEAQRSEWMGDLYREIRRMAEAGSVSLLCWYSAATDQEPTDPRVDVWGLLEGLGREPLPKAIAARGD